MVGDIPLNSQHMRVPLPFIVSAICMTMVIISPSERLLRLIAGVMGIKALCKASPQLIPMSDPIPMLSSSPGLIRSYPLNMLGSSVEEVQQQEHSQHSWGYIITNWGYNIAHWRYNISHWEYNVAHWRYNVAH